MNPTMNPLVVEAEIAYRQESFGVAAAPVRARSRRPRRIHLLGRGAARQARGVVSAPGGYARGDGAAVA